MGDIRAIAVETRLSGVKGLWYLATPYAKYPLGVDTAATHAAQLAAALIMQGVHVFSPITHGHAIKHYTPAPGQHDWLALNELIMEGCQGLIVARMPGYHYSSGVQREIKWFERHNKPVLYLDVRDILGVGDDVALGAEAEAKLMGEPQPMSFKTARAAATAAAFKTEDVPRWYVGHFADALAYASYLAKQNAQQERDDAAASYDPANPTPPDGKTLPRNVAAETVTKTVYFEKDVWQAGYEAGSADASSGGKENPRFKNGYAAGWHDHALEVSTTDEQLDRAAKSLADMVSEWYVGLGIKPLPADLLRKRLARFMHVDSEQPTPSDEELPTWSSPSYLPKGVALVEQAANDVTALMLEWHTTVNTPHPMHRPLAELVRQRLDKYL